ncbi:MAG: hypothetical protein AAF806_22560 [Bacteroidota bacterium]
MNKVIFIVILLFFTEQGYCQINTFPTKGISLSYALTQESFKDERLTFRNRVEDGFITTISYFQVSERNLHRIDLGFGKNRINRNHRAATIINLRPQLTYTFQRKFIDWYVGGTMNIGSLLSFPNSNRWAGNNTISYTIWSSLGISGRYQKPFELKNQRFHVVADFHFPLLSYLIRPTYGLPYPSNYLEDGTFDFQRQNLTSALLRSGKIRSLDQFQYLETRLGLSTFLTSKQHEIRLSYLFDYFNVNEVKPVRQIRNGLELSGAYKF